MTDTQGRLFDERFLDRHAGSIIHDPAVSIVELVAKAWERLPKALCSLDLTERAEFERQAFKHVLQLGIAFRKNLEEILLVGLSQRKSVDEPLLTEHPVAHRVSAEGSLKHVPLDLSLRQNPPRAQAIG